MSFHLYLNNLFSHDPFPYFKEIDSDPILSNNLFHFSSIFLSVSTLPLRDISNSYPPFTLKFRTLRKKLMFLLLYLSPKTFVSLKVTDILIPIPSLTSPSSYRQQSSLSYVLQYYPIFQKVPIGFPLILPSSLFFSSSLHSRNFSRSLIP